jgi:hypothetical protein
MARIDFRLDGRDLETHPDLEVMVGWDGSLSTYYARVIEGKDGAGNDIVTVDIGHDYGEITDISVVAQALADYADLSDEVVEDLDAISDLDISHQDDEGMTPADYLARRALKGEPGTIETLAQTEPEPDWLEYEAAADSEWRRYGSSY